MDNYIYVPREKAITVILQSKEDGLHLCYASEYYCQLISSTFPYDKNELLSKYIAAEYYNELVHICKELETHSESYQCSFNYYYRDMIVPLYIHITSFQHEERILFFLTANDINRYDFINTILVDHEVNSMLVKYNPILKNSNYATAIFNCKNPSHPKIERINVQMLELAVQTSILKEPYFYETKLFNRMMESKSTVEDEVINHQKHTYYHYKIILIPIIDNDVVLKAIFIILNSNEPLNSLDYSSKLTPRENEVIEYVLMGVKNDYIAQKLNVSIGTIKRTIFNVYNKLGISSRVELINYYHSLDNDKE